MNNVTECVQRLQDMLGEIAEKAAEDTHFIRQKRKISATNWLLATVFGWMNNKNAT